MKGDITRVLLEALSETAQGAGDFFAVFLTANKGTGIGGFQYRMAQHRRARNRNALSREEELLLRRRYHDMIFKLKRDGLLRQEHKSFSITRKGLEKLKKLRERKKNALVLPPSHYVQELGNQFVIIAFDIPETQRKKRDWLRAVLRDLGMTMIQKSVWMGKIKIPKQFLDDLLRLKLIEHVEILEVSKSGSLRHIA